MTLDDIIGDLLEREGPPSNDPVDSGGRTKFGISEKANADLWADGDVTREEAMQRYKERYFFFPGFDRIPFEPLAIQLLDYGVNSGPALAIVKLQQIVGAAPDGVLGNETLTRLALLNPVEVNNKLVAERVKMFGRICTKTPSQLRFLNGWLNRALSFLV